MKVKCIGTKVSILTRLSVGVLAVCLWGCSPYKNLEDGEYLLTKNKVYVNGKSKTTSDDAEYLRQNPNRRFLGMFPLYMNLYCLASEDPEQSFEQWAEKNKVAKSVLTGLFSEKGFGRIESNYIKINKWLHQIGEAPVIYDPKQSEISIDELEANYFNQGYFNASGKYDTTRIGKNIKLSYRIETGKPYIIDSFSVSIDSPVLQELYQEVEDFSEIHPAEQYNEQILSGERNRLTTYFQERGVYNFQKNYITFIVDTADYKATVQMNISNPSEQTLGGTRHVPFQQYNVSQIKVFTDHSYENHDKQITDTLYHNGIMLLSSGRIKYRPRVITDDIFLKPGGLFSLSSYNESLSALRSLRIFQSANIVMEPDKDTEDPSLIANVYLTPVKRFSFSADVEATRSSLLGFGSTVSLSLTQNNAFRGGEIWRLSFSGTVGNHYDTNSDSRPIFNAYEITIKTDITFPRFLLPFNTEGLVPKQMMPRTNLSASFSFQKNIGLDRNYFNLGLDYSWSESTTKKHNISLARLSFVRNLNKLNYFNIFDNQDTNNALESYLQLHPDLWETYGDYSQVPQEKLDLMNLVVNDTDYRYDYPDNYRLIADDLNQYGRYSLDYFIPAMSYTFTYNNQPLSKTSYDYFQGELGLAGNLFYGIYSLFDIKKQTLDNGEQRYTLFGLPFTQFVKANIDYRHFWKIREHTLAFRIFGGAIIPYGNSDQIPFIESYFGGGVNWERGWLAYELGPGGIQDKTYTYNVGNVRFITSFEWRFPIYRDFWGALFADAGNVWYSSKKMTMNDAAVFRFNSFYKQLGVDTGVGLRYDFNYFVLRMDVGLKVFDPAEPEGNRWVLHKQNFGSATYNIAIAYPF